MLYGSGESIPWGAAVSAALEFLKGSSYVSFNGVGYEVTERGKDALAGRPALGVQG